MATQAEIKNTVAELVEVVKSRVGEGDFETAKEVIAEIEGKLRLATELDERGESEDLAGMDGNPSRVRADELREDAEALRESLECERCLEPVGPAKRFEIDSTDEETGEDCTRMTTECQRCAYELGVSAEEFAAL